MDSKRLLKIAAGAGAGLVALKALDKKYQIASDVEYLSKVAKGAFLEKLPADATIVDLWEKNVAETPNKTGAIFAESGESLTFAQLDALASRVAHMLRAQGLAAGDVVALFADNSMPYLYIYLGILKAGMVAALINSNNKAKPLLHSLDVAKCRALIYGAEVESAVADVAEGIAACNLQLILSFDDVVRKFEAQGILGITKRLEDELPPSSPPSPRAWRSKMGKNTAAAYIYTSGTTGLPKACVVRNSRLMTMGLTMNIFGVERDDVTYTCLPLYHSSGLGIGFGNALVVGSTIVISRKFSATRFFQHCAEHNVTAVQYIGELFRYLANTPASPWDRRHKVRVAVGNGLRREIWVPFQERFQIPEIGEFYGATEGNISFMNHCRGVLNGDHSRVGAVGRVGPFIKKLTKFRIVKHDVENEAPVRDPKTGFCIECAPGEPGELLGYMDPDNERLRFVGYTSKEASDKKILKDVLVKGDSYFRTGDLLRHDSDGFLYFVDRVGDTFRYKGENVATGEVAQVVGELPGVLEANVYGVQIPGSPDGRACMSAIVLKDGVSADTVDLAALSDHVHRSLATYAVPHFVRILPQMDLTGTFKHRKVDLAKDGFDPAIISDPLFYLDTSTREYKPLTAEAYADICAGKARL